MLLVVLILFGAFVKAQADQADLEKAKEEIFYLFKKVQRDLYAGAPSQEKRIIERVRLNLTDGMSPLGALAVKQGSDRLVVFTQGFLSGLYNFILASELERAKKINGFSEHVIFESAHMTMYNDFNMNVFEMAGDIPKSVRNQVEQTTGQNFFLSLIPIFAHEFGHHITDGFYDRDTPDYKKRVIEDKADDWAWRAIGRSNLPGLGAFYSLFYFHTHDVIKVQVGHPASHSEPLHRVEVGLNETIKNMENLIAQPNLSESYKASLNKVLSLIREIRMIDANRNADFYERRGVDFILRYRKELMKTEKGNQYLLRFAAADYYRAALMLLKGQEALSDNERVVDLLKSASRLGYPPANNYLGFLYQKGLYVDQDLLKAKGYYQKAADEGYVESIKRLEFLQ